MRQDASCPFPRRTILTVIWDPATVALVVSEETGIIPLAVNGKLKRGFTTDTLMAELTSLLIGNQENQKARIFRPHTKQNEKETEADDR